jgi:hypothetical protein
VHLASQRPATADIVMTERAAALSTVTVRGQLAYSRNLDEFEARRLDGWELVGHFIGPADLEKRPNTRLGGLLQGIPGLSVDNRRGDTSIRMRATGKSGSVAWCTPSLYIDGTRDVAADFGALDSDGIAAVEVYPRETGRPFEFMDGNACGSIAVWTRAPVAKVKDSPPPGTIQSDIGFVSIS